MVHIVVAGILVVGSVILVRATSKIEKGVISELMLLVALSFVVWLMCVKC